MLKQTGIKLSNKQQVNSNQNFKALFGKVGLRKLKSAFDPCCGDLTFTKVCYSVNGKTNVPLCDIKFPICARIGVKTSPIIKADSFLELLTVLGGVIGKTAYSDGCDLIIISNRGTDIDTLLEGRCVEFLTCDSSGTPIDFNIVLNSVDFSHASPDNILSFDYSWFLFNTPVTPTAFEISIDGVNWETVGSTNFSTSSGSTIEYIDTVSEYVPVLYARIRLVGTGVISNVVQVNFI